jgi:hypothetical protein
MELPCQPDPPPATDTPLVRLGGHALVVAQLALILLVVYRYEVAARNHLFPVLGLAVGGYVVHATLPPRLRAGFFAALSLAAAFFVLGWTNAGYLIGTGGAVLALCYLPVRFPVRVVLAVAAAAVLTVLRADTDELAFWPVFGSMIMFRLIVFLIDTRRGADRPPLALAVGYFFPLQNLSFLFFPILDFKTFRDTYRADAGWRGAQAGVGWVATGLLHLLGYRVVKYYLLPAPSDLGDLPHVALFLAAGYALYLHVSGYFHVITGVFHLFGFHLPRTHHHFFLASSFTDVWRRINIYWKDFMAKVFFQPAFFALRGWGTYPAVVLAALWVFLWTWLLHAYQVFWLTGQLPLNLSDAWLWLGAGVLVAANLLYGLRQARRAPADRRPGRPLLAACGWAARVAGMFALVCVFWACWNTPTIVGYVRVQASSPGGLPGGGTVALALAAAGVALTAGRLAYTRLVSRKVLPAPWSVTRSAAVTTAALGVASLLSVHDVAAPFGDHFARAVRTLRQESQTPAEAARAVQGYYEEIADAPVRAGDWLTGLEGRARPKNKTVYPDMSRPTDEYLERELIANWSGEVNGRPLTINRHGMRDRADRTVAKPAGTARLAVVGSSNVMGYGVGDADTFPFLLEDRLNAARRPDGPRYEVLNFGTGKSYAIHRRVLLDRRVFAFAPDVVVYVAHQDELEGVAPHLAAVVAAKLPLPSAGLDDVVRRAGVEPGMPVGMARARLQPVVRAVVAEAYCDFAAACQARGARPVWVYVPIPGVVNAPGLGGELGRMAAAAGFDVIDLSDWADQTRPAEVKLGPDDHHLNERGHRLVADRLADELARRPGLIR